MVDVAKTAAPVAAVAPRNLAIKAAPSTLKGKRETGESQEQKKLRKEGIAARRKASGK